MKKKILDNEENELPFIMRFFRWLWFIILAINIIAIIVGLILLILGHFYGFLVIAFTFLTALYLIVAPTFIFEPEILEYEAEKYYYIQQRTALLREKLYANEADIEYRSTRKKASSIKEGIKIENCPKCGDKVDANEEYCNKCGTHLLKKCKKCKSICSVNDKFCKHCGNSFNN